MKHLPISFQRLIGYLVYYKIEIIQSLVFMFFAGVASSLIAKVLGVLTDVGFYEQEKWIVFIAPISLVIIAFMHGFSMFMSNYLLGKVSQSILKTLRQQILHNSLRWPALAYQQNPAGMVASKFVLEANVALSNAAKSVIVLVRDTIQVIALSLVLFWHNWMLALISLVIGPAVVFLLRYIAKRMKGAMASSQESIAGLMVRVKEAYEAQRVIKLFNTYDQETQRISFINEEIRKLMLKMTKIGSLGTPLTQFIGMVGIAIVLLIAMVQTSQGLLTLGEFVTFLAALLLIMPPLRHLAGLNSAFVGMQVAADSIFQTLDIAQEEDKGTQQLQNCKGQVTFENVSLRYPNAPNDAVHNFNLRVKPGQVVALVGLSGSGKTSIANMLPRFWNPTSGRILLDGIDTQDLTLASLREQIAIVSQEAILFDGTIRDNILYGSKNVTQEQLQQVVEAAALKDFVASLPEGLDTPVGECGNKLSGGQKQRVSIARALLKDAPILILDEATSALDSESELHIKESLEKLMAHRTVFMVAHRLSTVENADIIVAMENGEIKEMGSRSELLAKQGLYAHLCELQSL